MKKLLYLAILIGFLACSKDDEQELSMFEKVQGKWIINTETVYEPLFLNSDSSFYHDRQKRSTVVFIEEGKFNVIDNKIIFTVTGNLHSLDTLYTISYDIIEVNPNESLTLSNNGFVYYYLKSKV